MAGVAGSTAGSTVGTGGWSTAYLCSLFLSNLCVWQTACVCMQALLVKFNKARQAKITQEISEIVAGANATG